MKKTIIVSITVLLAACSSGEYVSEVTSESYKEDYTPSVEATAVAPVAVASTSNATKETTKTEIVKSSPQQQSEPQAVVTKTQAQPAKATAADKNVVKIVPPSKKQADQDFRYGFTIQVAAVGTKEKVALFSNKLPKNGQPVWENYKIVNGTKWYSVLYGDYATRSKAQSAIATLPKEFQALKPFVKSIDKIKKSDYPTLSKLN
ncbi:cytochrome C biogenesis protein CcdA [Vibrio sp. 10N.286.49.C2]|uniref:SPOR domain-containing protein n=1 Tax=unclassified Vibrio TaxID=2614977 RepID=UPI000C826C5D|nr:MULTISPECIES: SPOR domain-containing protein [unclassified Vibrio]PMH38305.1 cytochrome C biogenesis protein CcdA [Vibrio sp. 10N.286.49.C2]PMH55713.1 cytochrome C biogenesis protein CcdA [Vibrio sp. 10N.286.49.B1]PMH79290.1 cytochrome C biogenesis protein CcdA [Vibrio sp. 10N.286.48.B7]